MKKKDWFTEKNKSNDKPLAYRCFNITTTPMLAKFITTATIGSNTDVEYYNNVDNDSEVEKMKADIDKLEKRVLTLEDKVKRLSDDVIFLTY